MFGEQLLPVGLMVLSDGMVHFLKIKFFFFLQIYQNYLVALISVDERCSEIVFFVEITCMYCLKFCFGQNLKITKIYYFLFKMKFIGRQHDRGKHT